MQEFIARENIRRFEARLDECTNPEQRETLSRLLEDARAELVEVETRKGVAGKRRNSG